MKTNSSLLVALAVGLSSFSVVQAEEGVVTTTSAFIQKLVDEALARHPKIDAAEARAQAATVAVDGVRLWEDPQLMLGGTAARKSMRMDDGDIKVALEQMLPRPSLYKAEKRQAIAEQAMQGAEKRVTSAELALSVAQSALELALADDLLRLQGTEVGELDSLVRVALERAKNPDSTAVETLGLESELELRSQTLEAAKRQRGQLAYTLNLLTGRAARAGWPALTLPGTVATTMSATTLLERMEKGNPSLAALRHKIEAAQAGTDAAKARRKPLLMVGVESSTYSGTGDLRDVMVTLKMSLPWFNDPVYKADISRAGLLHDAAQYDLAAQLRSLDAGLVALITTAENQGRLADAYRDQVLPKQTRSAEAVQNAWISSKATLLEVLEARRLLLNTRMEMKRALAVHHAALHGLTTLTGGSAASKFPRP